MNILKLISVFTILFLFKIQFAFSQTANQPEREVIVSNSRNTTAKPVDKNNAQGKTEISSEKTILNSSGRHARPIEINEKTPVSNEKQSTEQKINSGTRVNNVNTNEQKLEKANDFKPKE